MKTRILHLAAHVLILSAMSASAAIRYVDVNGASPVLPYTNWLTAATTIQDAVNAAVIGDQILVTNGVYETGGRVAFGAMTNRVAVNKPVTVRSVNGAAVTVIRGFQVPGTTNGDSAIRCVYLANGAALVGFTLTNGATRGSGDELRELSGGGVWSESTSAVISYCTLSGNSAKTEGGGASGGTLNNCTLIRNSALQGGGADDATLNNCTLTANSAAESGGGAARGMLNNCRLSGNLARHGSGGGAFGSTLNNCTLTANSAFIGGGASGTLNNCIVYYNSASFGDNYFDSILSYSCTTPLPPEGVGNISAEPELADLSHLNAASHCRGAGSAAYATGLDIDGEPWANPPCIGCDQYHAGAVTGLLRVSIQAAYTNAAVGFAVNFTAAMDGRAIASRWEFGDGTVVSNRPYAPHSWTAAGDYKVVLQANNDTYQGGISATVTVHVLAPPVHYVALGSSNPMAPYTSWATAANNIQDAVDAASLAGALVLVTNGVYQIGGRAASPAEAITNRVAVTKALMVRSVNGAAVTIIKGYRDPGGWPFSIGNDPVRCVYLSDGAALVGFTLTNGAGLEGGGVWCETASTVVSNCVLTGNVAGHGGGANGGTLSNCILYGNSTGVDGGGGGAFACRLNNCTLSGNLAEGGWYLGSGAVFCTLNNCIAYYNTLGNGQDSEEDNYRASVLSYSCTTPLPSGTGNFTNAPLFADYAGGNLRLQPSSPCINAGYNASAPTGPDLDGNPRSIGGVVDVGAYEFQSPRSLISYAWLQQYGLSTDGSADYADGDGDGLNNWQEWRVGTNPTNALSVLRMLSTAPAASGVILRWQSVGCVNYFLERSTNLTVRPSFLPIASTIVGQPGTTTFTDTNAVGAGPFFYRIGVQE